jgi:antitoxin MazE
LHFDQGWVSNRLVMFAHSGLPLAAITDEMLARRNSLAVRIPKAVADALNVSDGRRAEIWVENGALVLRPLLKPTRKPRYTLDELLSGMTKENVPQEVDWGPPRGNEAW